MSSYRIFNTFEKKSSAGVPYTEVVGKLDVVSGGSFYINGNPLVTHTGRFIEGVFNSTTKGYGIALSSTYTATHRIYSDDGGAVFGNYTGDIRGLLSRVLITKDHSSYNNRVWGLMGHIKSYDGEWGDEQWAGVHGYLELVQNSGTINFQQYGVSAGVMSTVETAGTMTVDTGHVLAGVAAISKLGYSGTLTQTGKVSAFYAGIYDTTNWSDSAGTPDKWGKGLFIKGTAVTEGINVGEFSSATYGSGVVLSNSLTGANRFYADDGNAAISSASSVPDVRNLLARTLITKDNSSNHLRLHSLMGHVKSYDGEWKSEQISGVHGYMELVRNSATINFQGYGVTAGVQATVETSGTMTVDANHTIAGLAAISKMTSGLTQTGKTAGLYVGIYDTTNWSDSTSRSAWKWGSYIAAGAATNGYYANCSAIGATGRVAQLYATSAAPNFTDGYGAHEIDITFSGTVAGTSAASSTWINMAASSSGGSNLICVQNNGIYVPSAGTPMASATAIIGMRMQYVAEGGENPGALYLFSTNIYSNALTAMFHVNAAADITWASGTKSGGTAGNFPIFKDVTSGLTHYVNTYTA